MKRGTDHKWEIVKYKGDIALYARCKCGFKYNCSSSKRDEKGFWIPEQENTKIFFYCPCCGARKKIYNIKPVYLDESEWR